MLSRTTATVLSIIFFNLIPLWGVIYENWSPFEMFWFFWLETLIISFFNAIRVLFSQGMQPGLSSGEARLHLHYRPAFKYLLARFFIFLFYALFIIVFIGITAHESNTMQVAKVIGMQDLLFNLGIILCFIMNAWFITRFFMSQAYLYSKTSDYPALFDGRQIVMHIAVVLGAVGSAFLFEKSGNPHYASIWIISIFCLIKCLFELFSFYKTKTAEQTGSLMSANI